MYYLRLGCRGSGEISRTTADDTFHMTTSHVCRLCYTIAAISFVLPACGPSKNQSDSKADTSPFKPPPISAVSIDGMRGLMEADRGSYLVVNLWATWCPPCVTEMPALAKFYEAYKDQEVTFLSFSADESSAIDELVRPFVNSYEIPFPVWVMDNADPEALNAAFGLGWDGLFPTTFLFTPDGVLAQRWEGEVTYEALSQSLDAALKAPAPKESAIN